MADEAVGKGSGGVVLLPKAELAVIEPMVAKTMSAGSTWMMPVLPFLFRWISSTVILVDSANENLVTLVSSRY